MIYEIGKDWNVMAALNLLSASYKEEMERRIAVYVAHDRMSQDGCPWPIPLEVHESLKMTFREYVETILKSEKGS